MAVVEVWLTMKLKVHKANVFVLALKDIVLQMRSNHFHVLCNLLWTF
jgi:hypothetical protein